MQPPESERPQEGSPGDVGAESEQHGTQAGRGIARSDEQHGTLDHRAATKS